MSKIKRIMEVRKILKANTDATLTLRAAKEVDDFYAAKYLQIQLEDIDGPKEEQS